MKGGGATTSLPFHWYRVAAIAALSAACASCSMFGPQHLRTDQVDYERALGDAQKREMLSATVALRFGDFPTFMTVSQVISSYTFGASGGPLLNVGSGADPTYAQASGTVSYSNHPTFTFVPTTGESYANAYIRPLPPTLILPLADSGIPVDLLLRLAVQSIGELQNATPLGGDVADGTPGFFELLRALRRLQLAGELAFRYEEVNHVGQVSMSIGSVSTTQTPQTQRDLATVRTLLGLSPKLNDYPVVYGQATHDGKEITMVTRSMLGIFSNLGAQIDVPADAVSSGATKPSVRLVGGETRPTVVVHVSHDAPRNAYVSITYNGAHYWIASNDFDSKYAFSVVQNLIALAEANDTSKAPILTIPAG